MPHVKTCSLTAPTRAALTPLSSLRPQSPARGASAAGRGGALGVALLSALPGETPLSVLRYVMHTPGYTKARAEWRDAVGRYESTMDVAE